MNTKETVMASRIIAETAAEFKVSCTDMTGPSRRQGLLLARELAWLIREHTTATLAEIGRMLGERDGSTVHNEVRRAEDELSYSKGYQRKRDAIQGRILDRKIEDRKIEERGVQTA